MTESSDKPVPDGLAPDRLAPDNDIPSDEELFQQVAELIAEQTDIDVDDIKLDSEFESLGIDSLDAIEIIFEAEEKYDLSIPDRAARSMRKVKDVVEGVATLLRGEEIFVPELPTPNITTNLDTGAAQVDAVKAAVDDAKANNSSRDTDDHQGGARATGG